MGDVSRRTVVVAAVWSAPVLTACVGAPLAAASEVPPEPVEMSVTWSPTTARFNDVVTLFVNTYPDRGTFFVSLSVTLPDNLSRIEAVVIPAGWSSRGSGWDTSRMMFTTDRPVRGLYTFQLRFVGATYGRDVRCLATLSTGAAATITITD